MTAPAASERAAAHVVFAALAVMAAIAAPAGASRLSLVLLALAAWWFGTGSRASRVIAILVFLAGWFASIPLGWTLLILAVVLRRLVATQARRQAQAPPMHASAADTVGPPSLTTPRRRERSPEEVLADWPPRARDVLADARREYGNGWLAPLLEHPRDYVRVAAVDACGHQRDAQAVPLLLPLVDTDDYPLRRAAADALARIGNADAVNGLIAAFTRAWQAQTRMDDLSRPVETYEELSALDRQARSLRELAEAFVLVGPPAIPVLLDAVRDGSDEGAVWAILPLGALGALDAVPIMLRRVGDKHGFLRSRVSQAIHRIGPATRPMLEEAIRTDSPAARRLAADLIRSFDGRPPDMARGPATRPA